VSCKILLNICSRANTPSRFTPVVEPLRMTTNLEATTGISRRKTPVRATRSACRLRRAPLVLSAFTGAGGLDLGLERAGFRVIACIEHNRQARETVLANRPNTHFLEPGDIVDLARTLQPIDLGLERGQLDLLAGAPPCQPFSKAAQWEANSMRGLDDPRSNCLAAFMLLVEAFLPAAIVIENVPGFAKGKNSALPLLRRSLAAINSRWNTRYLIASSELNAADFGVPQRRHRAILIARRDGRTFKWPEETHRHAPVRAFDALHDIRVAVAPKPTGKWSGLLSSIPEGKNYQWHTTKGGGVPLFGHRTKFWSFLLKLSKGEPAWTLPAQPGPATGPFHWDSRPLAIAEMLRLQTFPLEWEVKGSGRPQILQVGNATPPLLAEVIGRAIGKQLFSSKYTSTPTLQIQRLNHVPPPEPVQAVPEKYCSLSGEHAPHPGPGRGPRPRPAPGPGDRQETLPLAASTILDAA
jgi:DNA (cytosine-5)-methyltransferase 1